MAAPTAIILAAGRSMRMKSRRPKVMQEICGRAMLEYVLRACDDAGCQRVLVVVGHGKDQIMAHFAGERRDERHITWVEQAEQLGTGHAAKMCQPELKRHPGDVLILAGDGPLVRGQVLQTLLRAHHAARAAASMATAVLDDPTGYGRVVRDAQGEFLGIVEEIDCTPEQRQIREIFPSYYCIKSEELLWALGKLTDANKKHEYYLTDIFGHLRAAGKKVLAVQAVAAEEVLGVNTRQQLAEADAIMQERIQRRFREIGVTIVSGLTTYIEDSVSIGPDTVIQPVTFIGRGTSIGADCLIGPCAYVPRESIVLEGMTIAGGMSAETAMKA
jgi:bifunctional UDP-N-acetylglucosamine pyrophosphorylase/glucosamine-1-phosphate N-acetyltransferase